MPMLAVKSFYSSKEPFHCPFTESFLACVASVPVRTERSIGAREELSHSGRAENGARAKRTREGGGGGERRERLPANPSILKNAYQLSRLISLND